MTNARKPPAGKDADLSTAFELTERLMAPSGQAEPHRPERPPATERLGQNLRYWLWRAGGRKRPALTDPIQVARLLDNYDIEHQRLLKTHEAELARLRDLHEAELGRLKADLAARAALQRGDAERDAARAGGELRAELDRERGRIAELERLTAELVRVHQAELARARAEGVAEGAAALAAAEPADAHADAPADADPPAALADALARVAKLERGRKAQDGRHAKELAALREEASSQSARARAEGMAVADAALRKAIERAEEAERQVQDLGARLDEAQADKSAAGSDRDALVEARRRIVELNREAEAARAQHQEDLARARADVDHLLADARRRGAELEAEVDRLHAGRTELERELAAARGRAAELETGRLRKAGGNAELDARLAAALDRATQAEDALQVANTKIDLLKDALEGAKARAAHAPPAAATAGDTRFRDAKRAFARQYHPDQGGRGDVEKERLFMDFWPVLERIEREG